MKRLCIVIEVDEGRPNLLLEAIAINAAVQAGGELRSAYVEATLPQSWLDKALGFERTVQREEFYPKNIESITAAFAAQESVT